LTRSTFKRKIYHTQIIQRDDLLFTVNYKKISKIYIKIHRNTAELEIIAPVNINFKIIDDFINKKILWIKKNQQKIINNNLVKNPPNINQINLFGNIYNLEYLNISKKIFISYKNIDENIILINYHQNLTENKKQLALEKFYRQELLKTLQNLIIKWQKIINVEVKSFSIRKMQTRYGSCNAKYRRIWFSLNLIHYKIEFIEYVVVHEIAHFFQQNHGKKFYAILDNFLPNWREINKYSKNLAM
jgi:predicted metal-dependent hydrolase